MKYKSSSYIEDKITLIITAWAGKLTPHARVAVQTRTLI